MEGITTAVLDEFPQLRQNMMHKTLFLAALCFAFYLMGLLLISDVSVSDLYVWYVIVCGSFVVLRLMRLVSLCLHRAAFTGSPSLTPSALVSA